MLFIIIFNLIYNYYNQNVLLRFKITKNELLNLPSLELL